jgi:hypothetical protein
VNAVDDLDRKLDVIFDEFRAAIYRAMVVQAIAIVGLPVSLVKLLP